ncbi:MAG: HNH endonuclease [Parcubacteria group bacterium]|jgi:putative restriction endonuclease
MKNNWKEFELILALRLYYQLPFGKMHKGNKDIIKLSKVIKRTPSSVAMKLSNFARLDTNLQKRQIKGLSNGSKSDEIVWNLYSNTNVLEKKSIEIIESLKNPELIKIFIDEDTLNDACNIDIKEGITPKGRDKQSFFRKLILSNFDNKCCITGLSVMPLLVASHIIPWSKNEENRLNPKNGFLLNSIHDKAFDRGYITINKDFKIVISEEIKRQEKTPFLIKTFLDYENRSIILPEKYLPAEEFIEYHNQHIFKG